MTEEPRESMNVVIVGHVDHGKSTLVGRLLADTGVLGEGKLEKVQETCKRQGKKFEYAFLLDALEEEQGQGITIDSARVFFKSDRRDYIIIDAPGHIEFLKNMVTGAARAEAAVLLIDANEGVKENSRRHGYLLSMLGIRQVVVAVNKIDLVGYAQSAFDLIAQEYREFLAEIGIEARFFIPVSSREGDMVAERGNNLGWYHGPSIIEAVDDFSKKEPDDKQPLRLVVQDIYKFNDRGDDRRIVAGRVEAGILRVGDEVVFSPSGKVAKVETIEAFSADKQTEAKAGLSTAFTLDEQIFVSRGEVVSHVDSAPLVSTKLRANLFWLGRRAMQQDRRYKLKLGTAETEVAIDSITRVLDASDLDATNDKDYIGRHDVADLVLRSRHPVAFDPSADIEVTGRFVIVDGYDIAGGGIIREIVEDELDGAREELRVRESSWARGDVTPDMRVDVYGHGASMVFITGDLGAGKHALARALEVALVGNQHHAYLLDGKNVSLGVQGGEYLHFDKVVRHFSEVAHILLDAGMLVISTSNVIGLTSERAIATRIAPYKMFVVHLGVEDSGVPEGADLRFDPHSDIETAVDTIVSELTNRDRLRQE